MKDIELEKCPIHGCKPEFIGPNLELPESIKHLENLYSHCPSYVLHREFPDALLFEHNYTVFCPVCAKKNPFGKKHNKFGYGFCSQYKLNEAKRNWNSACRRYYKHAIKNVLDGKVSIA
jgi:hypothetical protein